MKKLLGVAQKSLLLLFGGAGDPPRGQPAPIPPERYRWVAYGIDGTSGVAELRASARVMVFGRYAHSVSGAVTARMTAVVASFARAREAMRGECAVAFAPVVFERAEVASGRFGERAVGRSVRKWISPGEDEEFLAAIRASGIFGGERGHGAAQAPIGSRGGRDDQGEHGHAHPQDRVKGSDASRG